MGGTITIMNTQEIDKSKLLLVEGQDEVNFFRALLEKLGKNNEVKIIEVGGKDKFKTEFPAIINMPGFSENIEGMILIRDADNNFQSAFQSVQNLLKRYGFNISEPNKLFNNSGIRIGVYIMPGDSESGMLEDLCLRTQSNNPIMECVEYFFKELEKKDIKQPSNMAKAKCQVFLAGMPKIVNSVGVGAIKGYWNLDHPALGDLRDFLNKL